MNGDREREMERREGRGRSEWRENGGDGERVKRSPWWTTRIHPHVAPVFRAGVTRVEGIFRGRLEGWGCYIRPAQGGESSVRPREAYRSRRCDDRSTRISRSTGLLSPRTHTPTHTCMYARTHARTHIHAHTYTRTHTHTHVHIRRRACRRKRGRNKTQGPRKDSRCFRPRFGSKTCCDEERESNQ